MVMFIGIWLGLWVGVGVRVRVMKNGELDPHHPVVVYLPALDLADPVSGQSADRCFGASSLGHVVSTCGSDLDLGRSE